MVKEGQLLLQIDPAPYRAAYNVGAANLEQANAAAKNASVTAGRARELVKQSLVSKRELDDAEAQERSTAAQVSAARAQLEAARINLSYANVTAPISGRASQLRVLEGALVGQGEATLLTTIEQVDPIYVYFDQPASDFERLRRAQAAGQVTISEGNKAEVRVIGSDGTEYPHVGTLDFSDVSVNPTTGAVAFRGVVPESRSAVAAGMYVTVQLIAGVLKSASRFRSSRCSATGRALSSWSPARMATSEAKACRRREHGRSQLDHRQRPRRRRPGGGLRPADGTSRHEGEPEARGEAAPPAQAATATPAAGS
jgi:membrane fusion protein (multidrug efflux system)